MPAAITHIVLGKVIHQKIFPQLDFPSFIVGTSFPDIRYASSLSRKQTHLKKIHLKDIDNKNPFLAGFQVHSLVDQIIKPLNHQLMSSLSLKITAQNILFFKFYQDKILYSKIDNWPQITSFFSRVYPQEIDMGISAENVRGWHIWLQKYFEKGLNKKTLKRLSDYYRQPKLAEEILEYFKELDKKTVLKKEISELVENITSLAEKE